LLLILVFLFFTEYGTNVVYLMNYVSSKSELYNLKDKELYQRYSEGLKKVYPHFKDSDVEKIHISRDLYASPVYDGKYSKKKTPIQTPIDGLYIANTAQIYPQDRNVNFSIELAKKAVTLICKK